MKPSSLFGLLVVLSAVGAGAAERPAVWNNPGRPAHPGLHHHSYESAAMGRTVGYNVYLPEDYAKVSDRYAVVYFLHGAGGNENSDAPGVAGLLARFAREMKIRPVIAVFPNGGYSGYRDHPETGIRVETALIEELVPRIDRDFRTIPSRESRTIFGFSMGGAGAVRLAVRHPELFSAAGSWGGAFLRRNAPDLPEEFTPSALQPVAGRIRLLLVVGTEDFTLASHPPFLRCLGEAKFPVAYHVLPDVRHDPGAYYRKSGEMMMTFIAGGR